MTAELSPGAGSDPDCSAQPWGSQGSARLVSFAGAGVGDVNVEVEDPQGRSLAEVTVEDKGNQVYRCVYKPVQAGPHIVKVTFAGEAIPKTPCNVLVGEGMLFQNAPKCRRSLFTLGMITEYARILPRAFSLPFNIVDLIHWVTWVFTWSEQCSLTVAFAVRGFFLPRSPKN